MKKKLHKFTRHSSEYRTLVSGM